MSARRDSAPDHVLRVESPRKKMPLAVAVVGHGMLVRRVSVAPSDVVFVKGILEASDGVAALFAESGGELSIVAPHDREAELATLLDDLTRDVHARLDTPQGDLGVNIPHRGGPAHV